MRSPFTTQLRWYLSKATINQEILILSNMLEDFCEYTHKPTHIHKRVYVYQYAHE